jgi:DNA mismatch repair ATPase MutL
VDAPSLSYAISDALKTYLPEKRFFQGVFHIDIDPKWIDINVHPQKKEIKFQEESYIRDVLRRLVTPANKEPVSFQKLEPVPLFNYEFKKPLSAEPLDLQIAPRFSYIKTIGYYPPYLLIDSEELDDPQFKKGLVFFDVKSAYTKKHTSLFLDNQLTLCSQGLLIAHPLKLAEADKKLLKNHQKFFDSLGINLNSENELVAHPQDLDIFSTIELIHIAITQLQKGLSEAQISLLIFEFISKYKRIDLEQAYRLLAHFTRDKIKDDHLFCVVSETKLKQLFYDKY